MAATKEKITLRVVLDGGEVNGKQKYIRKNFSNITLSAEDLALYEAGEALSQLFEADTTSIEKVEVSALSAE